MNCSFETSVAKTGLYVGLARGSFAKFKDYDAAGWVAVSSFTSRKVEVWLIFNVVKYPLNNVYKFGIHGTIVTVL